MRSEGINAFDSNKSLLVNFEGKRLNRNIITQLAKSNPYSLNEPNQRLISNAIADLSKVKGAKNIEFLMEMAAKSKYSTNIVLEDLPKNNWKGKLLGAAMAAVGITAATITEYSGWIDKILEISQNNELQNEEKEILALRNQLLSAVDTEQIKKETVGPAKDFQRNLDYFIVSSETTVEHKKYVLEKLNYFMSDDYEINPQLADKKSVAVAEMVNDMAIAVPGNKIPNIKAVNQKQHGMCAAISIVRKKLAYEDKPNYVDSIISELDSSPYIMVYDRANLGSGKRVPVVKIDIDYKTALDKGYRIIDTATMYWMQIAHMGGTSHIAYNNYHPFDSDNFDVMADSFMHPAFEDDELAGSQGYYQALLKVKEVLDRYKSKRIKDKIEKETREQNFDKNIQLIGKVKQRLTERFSDLGVKDASSLVKGVVRLEYSHSDKISNGDIYSYIPNEEELVKKSKVKNYILANSSIESLSDQELDRIYSLVDYYNQLQKELHKVQTKSSKIVKAQELYEIGAAFRYQIIRSLDEEATLINLMKLKGVPNREELINETIDTLIEKLETNSSHSQTIIENIAKNSGCAEIVTKEDAIDALTELKDTANLLMTGYVDEIYSMLASGSRHEMLINFIASNEDKIANGDENVLNAFADTLGVKPDIYKVLSILDEMKESLHSGDEEAYKTVYNKLGNYSQVRDLYDLYYEIVERLQQEGSEELIASILMTNELPIEDNLDSFLGILNSAKTKIDALDNFIIQAEKVLKIVAKDGEVLYSAIPKDAVIEKLENDGVTMPSYAQLKELQTHLYKIQKDNSTDEFSSRQGKLKDKNLYNFSNSEKETLKNIEKSIDIMSTYVEKELISVRADLKDELEELGRFIGVQEGRFWTTEGSSGLSSAEQIRILEYMTDRPYYETEDVANAIEKIKKGPYSGITTSSVYNDKSGWHSQYVADIAPVKVKVRDKDGTVHEETKEVLFHDNTWGASEAENVWTDSYGLQRTDYSDNRGGTLGYITDDKFRNGNFVERILQDMVYDEQLEEIESKIYKRISRDELKGSFKSPQYSGIIIEGKSPKLRDIAAQIHDSLFLPSGAFLSTLKLQSAMMTEQEANDRIKRLDMAGKTWDIIYDKLDKRIHAKDVFSKKIETREDYNNLADDDYLKVVLEKVALKRNGRLAGRDIRLAKVKNVKDLAPFKKEQRRRAVESFKYSFGKSGTIVQYLAANFKDEQFDDLFNILKNMKSETTEEQLYDALNGFVIDDLDKFDGSMAKTIELIMENVSKDIDAAIKEPDARQTIKDYFRNFLLQKAYFQKEDINDPGLTHLVKFIDRVYDPADDDEFVEIFRRIQDMPTEQFKKEVLSKATIEDLGLKTYTGYDILKKIKMYEDAPVNDFMNTIFFDQLASDINMPEVRGEYNYKRFKREPKSMMKYDFETIYRTMKYDLQLLTLEKSFNKYKDRNLAAYGAYPAYPQLEVATQQIYNENFNALINVIEDSVRMVKSIEEQKEIYSIAHELKYYVNEFDNNHILTEEEFNSINIMLGKFITMSLGDESMEETVNLAMEIMEIPQGSAFGSYKNSLNKVLENISYWENTTPAETINMVEEKHKKNLSSYPTNFVKTHIQNRYHSEMEALINDMIQAKIYGNNEKYNALKDDFFVKFKEYHRLHNPEEILTEYIKSQTKDSSISVVGDNLQQLLQRALGYAVLADIQWILMDAIGDGTAMDAKSLFKTISVKLNENDEFTMSSDEVIKTMVNSLVIDQKVETALFFMDKLGLNEQYVKYMAKSFDYDLMMSETDRAIKLALDYNNFKSELMVISKETINLLTSEKQNYLHILNSFKKELSVLCNKYKFDKEDVLPLFTSIDLIKETCLANPDNEPWLMFTALMNKANSDVDNAMNKEVEQVNNSLVSNEVIMNMINQIYLTKDSEADLIRNEMNEKFKDVEAYIQAQKDINLPAQQ